MSAAKTSENLIAHIEVPSKPVVRGGSILSPVIPLVIDLGRFMERTGTSFEVTQVEGHVLKCVCADHPSYTALRLAYGPFFIEFPRPVAPPTPDKFSTYNMKSRSTPTQRPWTLTPDSYESLAERVKRLSKQKAVLDSDQERERARLVQQAHETRDQNRDLIRKAYKALADDRRSGKNRLDAAEVIKKINKLMARG